MTAKKSTKGLWPYTHAAEKLECIVFCEFGS